jgi:hypothetical protein
MKKVLTALFLSLTLLTPAYAQVQEYGERQSRQDQYEQQQYDQQRYNEQRYYHKRHKDYHQWSGNEDQAWRVYWQQRHRHYIDWDRSNQRQRQAYWNWRHQHTDAVLQINIR